MTVKNFGIATIENITEMIVETAEKNNVIVDISNFVQDAYSFAMDCHNNQIVDQHPGCKMFLKNYYDAIALVERYVPATNPAFNRFFAVIFMTAHEYLAKQLPPSECYYGYLSNIYGFALHSVEYRTHRTYIYMQCNLELRRWFPN